MFRSKTTHRALVALSMLLLTVVSGCARPPEAEKEPEEPKFQGELSLWIAGGLTGFPGRLEDGWASERARAFEALHPGITVSLRQFDTGEELEAALLTSSAQLPDLVFGRPMPGFGDRLATLDPLLTPEVTGDLLPGALAAFQSGGKSFGLPVLVEAPVLALNGAAFGQAGLALPAEGRWSEEEFAQALGKLSGTGLLALGFSVTPEYHEWWPLADGLLTADQKAAPGAQSGLRRLAEWRQSGLLAPDLAMLSQAEAYQRFAAGRMAILPVSLPMLPLLRADKVDLSVAAFPGGKTAGYVYGFTFGKQADTTKLKSALALAEFIGAPDQQVRQARATGLLPVRKSAGNPFDGDPLLTRAWQVTTAVQPLPSGPVWDQAQEPIARELLLTLTGNKEPAAALTAIEQMATTPR